MARIKRAMTIQGMIQCCHCEERLRRDAAIQGPLAPRLPPLDCFVGLRPPRNDGEKLRADRRIIVLSDKLRALFYIASQHNPV